MDAVWWFLIISLVLSIISMIWTSMMVVVHVVVTLIISYWSAKLAARPILNEAVKIRRGVFKGISQLTGLDVTKDLAKSLAGRKGGSVKQDPVGSFLKEKVGIDLSWFKGGTAKASDENRVLTIINEEKAKRGIRSDTGSAADSVPLVK